LLYCPLFALELVRISYNNKKYILYPFIKKKN